MSLVLRSGEGGVNYTQEQLSIVQRINNCSDFYEMLQVSEDASSSAIKDSYKKLALRLHPDKNKAPGATEAFKSLATAYTVLNDDQTRAEYNLLRRNKNLNMRDQFKVDVDPDVVFACAVGIGIVGLGVLAAGLIWKLFASDRRGSDEEDS